ncbi:hypothetical protein [Aliiglaciecola lipolytica]|uniref:hypothetical protein n=1 Tax=Aliiglaciecola lipolytica TaxID=477689 RepID=UPI001C09223C|nr:hypothetical protein [Aliiglaciecola lipolytica]MBU2877071.1 hypothetical protein [Aliiglaciecola lipolytica]
MKYDHLSHEHRRFAIWLSTSAPQLLPLFDFDRRCMLLEKANKYLRGKSESEKLMASFFMSVFGGADNFGFDLFTACKILDVKNIEIIRGWLADPIWP